MIDLNALLSEEKSLGKKPYINYKLSSLESINSQIEAMGEKKSDKLEEIRQKAIELEYNNQDSITLMFVAGRINILLNSHESQVRLTNLMNSFYENRNSECAEFVASIIIRYVNSPVAMRVLGDIAASRNDEKSMWEYYTKYVKCNSSDTEVILLLARHLEEIGDTKGACNYYQRTLLRLITASDGAKTIEIFDALLKNGESDFSFYSSYISKLGKTPLAFEVARKLLEKCLIDKDNLPQDTTPINRRRAYDRIISVCNTLLSISPENTEIKEKLSVILKERYSSSSRYAEVSKKHDVLKSQNPVKTLDEFLKNIAYSKNTYVVQNSSSKVGIITDVSSDGFLTVKFSSRPGDELRIHLNYAVSSLTALSNEDFRAIKKGVKKETIRNKILVAKDYKWLLKTLLFSSPEKTNTMKGMKEMTVPSVLSDGEWDEVAKELKSLAANDEYIEIVKNSYRLMEYPSTKAERVYVNFIKTREFDKRVSILLDASKDSAIGKDSDEFLDMVKYFSTIIKDYRASFKERIESLLVIESIGEDENILVSSDVSFQELYSELSRQEKKDLFVSLSCKATKDMYIKLLQKTDKNAFDVLSAIFPSNPTKELADNMEKFSKSKFSSYVKECLSDYMNNGTAFCAFIEIGKDPVKYGVNENTFIINKLDALSSLFMNRLRDERQIRILQNDLLGKENEKTKARDGGKLDDYIRKAKEDNINALVPHLVWNNGISQTLKNKYKDMILSRFPSIVFEEKKKEEEKPVEISVHRGFMCTKAMFIKKQAELMDIKEVQIPHTLKEISTARELGDLRENSEYQYAKEHKAFLDREYERLANDLSSVKIMSMDDVLDGRVGFGTKVRLKNLSDSSVKEYTFFGRWESNPDENVIDINAPIGEALINRVVGEQVSYTIGGNSFSYEILEITRVQF